jgi:hypothetical protein
MCIAQRRIADYDQTAGAMSAFLKAVDGKQPGDAKKGAKRIVDVLTLSGAAAGHKEIPVRLALGKDAYAGVRAKCEATLGLLEEWKEVSCGTDHDDVAAQ